MKAISICQPWATLIVAGVKHFETRSWKTLHRGPLAIHAASAYPRTARALCLRSPYREALVEAGVDVWERLPCGVVLGVVELVDCNQVEELGEIPATQELLGDFRPGQWMWRLANARMLSQPKAWRGRLGLFDVPDEVLVLDSPAVATNAPAAAPLEQGA
jgi:hypothetical protein